MKNSTITKLLFFISLLGLCFSSIVHAEEKHTNVIPINITNWCEDKNTSDQKLNPLLKTKSAEIQLYHNNGNPIKTNILESSPKTAQMNTKIRTSNTAGNLGLQLRHTYVRAGGTTHSTGIVSTYISDR
ncbi:hypothetical protein OCA08_25550 [Bacillus cereus]|nr:hypothetical protein [Bacillus cereus]